MFDLIITGGMLIDGTGCERRQADIGVRQGRIAAIGRLGTSAAQVIDAAGLVVTPGFVDVHTHYDAQILWDPFATPSNLHGVTSVIGGNCGFSIAPMAAQHVDYVTRMLAKVEGIPLEALVAGLDFGWQSFGQYLGRLDGRLGINAGFLAGHSTIRRLVMNERATVSEASDEDLRKMCDLLRACLSEGALGFSSTWHPIHNDGDGNPVPSRAAAAAELVALAGVAAEFPGTMLEFAPGVYGEWGDRETRVMIDMSLAAGRPINWNPARVRETNPDSVERQLRPGTRAAEEGACIIALAYPFPSSTQLSLSRPYVYDTLPGWRDTMYLPLQERMRVFADPAQRRRLEEGAARTTQIPAKFAADWSKLRISRISAESQRCLIGKTVGEVAKAAGKSAFDTYLDIALADGLQTYVSFPIDADDDESWRMRVKLLRDPRTVLGGSDAGAHLDSICNATLSTRLLGEFVRERGLLSLEEAIRMITDVPARFCGLRERGRLQEGWHADIVVLDPAAVAPRPLELRHDFPAGAPRLYAEADGIRHVLVNGVEVTRGGLPTGQRPGVVLRSGTDTESASR
ncbi:MAG: D-aminoacylase [Betaproteobacteria bacterium]|nr:D-aminoacylase [Betaproteobacteria bacterium]